MIKLVEGLTFDDVLLKPKFSKIKTRKNPDVDLSVELSKGLKFDIPVIPANMKTVTGMDMAHAIYKMNGLAILHRFNLWTEQKDDLGTCTPDMLNHIGFSVGVKKEDYAKVDFFAKNGVKILCVDIAHGDSELCVEMTRYISETYPKVFLIAGNVATADGAERLWRAGADCVKVGVGPGSLCTTRIETGNGVPQLTALSDVYDRRKVLTTSTESWKQLDENNPRAPFGYRIEVPPPITKPIYIIADGGIKAAGDIVKALCFSDMVMAGNLFAGTTETPGEIMTVSGEWRPSHFKRYEGSSTHKTNHIEGVSATVPFKGPVKDVMIKLCEGVRSGLSYQGCSKVKQLQDNPEFVLITSAGLRESNHHDVKVI